MFVCPFSTGHYVVLSIDVTTASGYPFGILNILLTLINWFLFVTPLTCVSHLRHILALIARINFKTFIMKHFVLCK